MADGIEGSKQDADLLLIAKMPNTFWLFRRIDYTRID